MTLRLYRLLYLTNTDGKCTCVCVAGRGRAECRAGDTKQKLNESNRKVSEYARPVQSTI